MSEQANEQIIKDLYDAFGRGDVPTILNMLAEDVDWYDPGPPAVTHAGRYRGRNDVMRFFTRLGESVVVEAFQPTEFIAKGDRVIVLGSLRGKVKQTGLVYDNEWAMSWTLRDGRVTKWQIFEDTARELAAHAPASAGAKSGGVSA
jgi:ketosteroid isomerase-like protein